MDLWNFIQLVVLLLISTQFFLYIVKYKLSSTKLPPGPFPLPIIGNITKLGTKPHKSLAELAKTYGPVMILQLGYQPAVVISSAPLAKLVLRKHDVSFSNRHIPDALRVHKHHESSVALLPSSTKWRALRKICTTQIFANSRLDATRDLRRKKVQQLLAYIRTCSETATAVDIGEAGFSVSLNAISNTLFSMDLADPGSQTTQEFRETVWNIVVEGGNPNLADFFPIFKRFDPQGIRGRTHMLFKKILDIFKVLIDERLQKRKTAGRMVEDNDVLDTLITMSQEKGEFQPMDVPHLLLDLFVAGTDSTSSTIEWAMAELLHNPETLIKARKELEQVIGKGNPIEETDIPRLPYLQAVVKETLRLHPPVPFLIPRQVDKDVELAGITVPKDAQVMVNVWAMGRNYDIWENANLFVPERFLASNIDFKGHDFEFIPFGAGRRICPGMPHANRIIHWVLGSLIHSFNWKLQDGVTPQNMDMDDMFGFNLKKAQSLCAIPIQG